MKYISRFLLAVVFYAAGMGTAEACQDFDPGKSCNKTSDTTAKKAPVKITIAPTPAANKPAARKEEKKDDGDFVSPLSWRPTFLY